MTITERQELSEALRLRYPDDSKRVSLEYWEVVKRSYEEDKNKPPETFEQCRDRISCDLVKKIVAGEVPRKKAFDLISLFYKLEP